jgi:hypothetical protein
LQGGGLRAGRETDSVSRDIPCHHVKGIN